MNNKRLGPKSRVVQPLRRYSHNTSGRRPHSREHLERCPYCGAWFSDGARLHVFGLNGKITCPTKLSKTVPEEVLEREKKCYKCPSCGQTMKISFRYQTESKCLEIYRPFSSIIFSCSPCMYELKIAAPRLDKPLGYFLEGTIIDFNSGRTLIKVNAPFPDSMLDSILDSGCFRIQDGKIILMLEHACDTKVLDSFKKLGELVEILVIGNKAVRLNAKN